MSKPVKPEAIGAFLLGGMALLIMALLTFGGGEFFKSKIHWVVYFDSSLNGLNVGAPVKVQGVQVGIVKEIELQLDDNMQKLMKPVVIEVDPTRLVSTKGGPIDISALSPSDRDKHFKTLLDSGLRARLEVQSILTGLLYVNLDFNRDQPARLTGLSYKGLPEVPSVPPTVDEVLATLEEVMRKIGNLPIEGVVEDLAAILKDVHALVGSEEAKRSQQALSQSLESAQLLLSRLEKTLPDLITHLDATVREVNLHARPVLDSTQATLENSRIAAGNIADVTEANSELSSSVKEVNRAAASLRELLDSLQRHPESLLFGKPD